MRKTLDIESILRPDNKAVEISNKYISWENYRRPKTMMWDEVQRYIFATSTKDTSNNKLPWRNTVTIPKLCQIRDNLHSNYMASLFPKRKWLRWEGDNMEAELRSKKEAIEGYMAWSMDRSGFYEEMEKVVLDYIDYGNCFVMPYWKDDRVLDKEGKESVGYVGPAIRRVSPLDIVFDPTAPSFINAPKIIRSFISLGEVKTKLEKLAQTPEELEKANELWDYMNEIRKSTSAYQGSVNSKDIIYEVAGFSNYRDYLSSNTVEVLTFYGDLFDPQSGKLQQNYVIEVIDRHKILFEAPHEAIFGYAPIFHAGWRVRPDNLWAMGPLDNLVGMQYRIDHLENMKADLIDLTAMPLIKKKGYVEPFEWRPMEEIILGDDGDVQILSPDVQALQYDTEIAMYEQKMEEMAGSPRESMGIRSPGEKTKYEVQRLELASGRIFQKRINQFEARISEPLSNAQLELARRNVDKVTIRGFDSEFKIAIFTDLTQEDITGVGFLRPVAARHFAEQANMVQNMNTFFSSAAGQDPNVIIHFSGEKLARMWEDLLEVSDLHIVEPYVRITEQADAQRISQSIQEQVQVEAQTPTGIGVDYDPEVDMEAPQQMVRPS